MCNLYSLTRAREAMLRLFRVSDNRAAALEPQAAIFPGYVAPVVRNAEDGERELVNLNWGFVLLQKGLAPRRVTNVRDDKILTSRFWTPSFQQRRCLVPASSYCEPKGVKPPCGIRSPSTAKKSARCLPSRACGRAIAVPLKKNGANVDQEVFAFMTTEPNELTQSINHERMPVLMSDPADFETWLSGSAEDAFKLARSYAAEQMRIVQFGAEREDRLEGTA